MGPEKPRGVHEAPDVNYQKHYSTIMLRARLRVRSRAAYYERHHVVPRCMGGKDNKENLVLLSAREHFVAHQLLAKMHPWHCGLQLAVAAMSWGLGRRLNNRRYEWVRRRSAKVQAAVCKARFTGVPKSEAQKKKMSDSGKGRKMSAEARVKLSRARRGVRPSLRNMRNRAAKLRELSLSRPNFSTGEAPILGVCEVRPGRFRWTLGVRYTGRVMTKSGFPTAEAAASARDAVLAQMGHLA